MMKVKLPHRRKFLHLAAGAAALPAVSRIARAQAYPTRPITIVVPFPPGGSLDTVGRILAERMRASLGHPVIIENVGGANGSIGVGRAARAAPDGYTISLGYWGTHVANGALYTLQYDVQKDFDPVALLSSTPLLIVSKKAIPANDLNGLITWLKANPDKASAGTTGVGAIEHLSGILFQNVTGTRFQFVPYRGAALAMQDLVAGQVDISIDGPITSLPQVRAGAIKAYAVTAKSRLAAAPDIPTVDEAGLSGFYMSAWYGFWVPTGTPKNIITTLNAATMDALADVGVQKRLAELGQEIFARDRQTPEALAAYQKSEIEKWWPVIKAAGIKLE